MFTMHDIVTLGPHLNFTDEEYNLLHPELYPQDWYNRTFLNTDWDAIKAEYDGNNIIVCSLLLLIGHVYNIPTM